MTKLFVIALLSLWWTSGMSQSDISDRFVGTWLLQVSGYVAYFGTYDVHPATGTVSHHRSAHINPELGSLTVVRYYQFDGDRLTLTVAPNRELRLIWQRAD